MRILIKQVLTSQCLNQSFHAVTKESHHWTLKRTFYLYIQVGRHKAISQSKAFPF